jgi:hypothetical protein
MVEFWLHRPQTGFDVAERFFESQLCKGHAQELIEARKCPQTVVAAIATDTLIEVVLGNEVHDLRENDPVGIHQSVLYRVRVHRKRPSFITDLESKTIIFSCNLLYLLQLH